MYTLYSRLNHRLFKVSSVRKHMKQFLYVVCSMFVEQVLWKLLAATRHSSRDLAVCISSSKQGFSGGQWTGEHVCLIRTKAWINVNDCSERGTRSHSKTSPKGVLHLHMVSSHKTTKRTAVLNPCSLIMLLHFMHCFKSVSRVAQAV
jgi:hypothetical protein